jgi:hypothetical protein
LADLSGQRQPLRSFDGRKEGYGAKDALAILCAMEMNKGAGKRAYLQRHFPLDMVFPLFYGPATAALFLFLLRSQGWHARALKYLALAPLVAAALDLCENMTVRSLVVAGPPVHADWVRFASTLTMFKYALVNASLAVTLALLIWYLVTRLGSTDRQA